MPAETKAFEPFIATVEWRFLPEVSWRTDSSASGNPKTKPPIKILSWDLADSEKDVVQELLFQMAQAKPVFDFITLQGTAAVLQEDKIALALALKPPYQIAVTQEHPPSLIIFDSSRWQKQEEKKSDVVADTTTNSLGANSIFTRTYDPTINSTPELCAATQVRVCSVVAPLQYSASHKAQVETFLATGHDKPGEMLANIAVGQFSTPISFDPNYLMAQNVTAGCLMQATVEPNTGKALLFQVPIRNAAHTPELPTAAPPNIDFTRIYTIDKPISERDFQHQYIKKQKTACAPYLSPATIDVGICTSLTPSTRGYLLQKLTDPQLRALARMQLTTPGFTINRQHCAAWIPEILTGSFSFDPLNADETGTASLPGTETHLYIQNFVQTLNEKVKAEKKAWISCGLFGASTTIGAWSLSAGLNKHNNLSLDFLGKTTQTIIGAAASSVALILFAATLYYCYKASSKGDKAIEKGTQFFPTPKLPASEQARTFEAVDDDTYDDPGLD